jgi:hypothetical protein
VHLHDAHPEIFEASSIKDEKKEANPNGMPKTLIPFE